MLYYFANCLIMPITTFTHFSIFSSVMHSYLPWAFIPPGAQVRARQAHIAKSCAVCAASYGLAYRFAAKLSYGVFSVGYNLKVRQNFLFHVAVLFAHGQNTSALAVFGVDKFRNQFHCSLFFFNLFGVMVTKNVFKACVLGAAYGFDKVIEAFKSAGVFRFFLPLAKDC